MSRIEAPEIVYNTDAITILCVGQTNARRTSEVKCRACHFIADMEQSPETGRLRATRRMSVVDYWSNETHGDGLNVTIAHHVNSWPALLDQLRGF